MARSIVMRFFFKNSYKKVAEKIGGIKKCSTFALANEK